MKILCRTSNNSFTFGIIWTKFDARAYQTKHFIGIVIGVLIVIVEWRLPNPFDEELEDFGKK